MTVWVPVKGHIVMRDYLITEMEGDEQECIKQFCGRYNNTVSWTELQLQGWRIARFEERK